MFHGGISRLPKIWIRRKKTLRWILAPKTYRLRGQMIFHGDKSKWLIIWIRKKYNYTGSLFNIFTRNMKIAYGNYIQWWHIKINQNLDSLETRLHGASGFLPKACGLHMEMISHGDRSRLVKIWIRRIYNYTRRQYLYSRFAKNTITLGLNICTQSMMITYGHDILWRQIKIVWILAS